MIQINIFSSL